MLDINELTAKYGREWEPVGEFECGESFFKPAYMRSFPITQRENLRRVLEHDRVNKPMYMPSASDCQCFSPSLLPDCRVRAWCLEIDPPKMESTVGPDMFGVDWEFVPITQGSMVRPGKPLVPDINHWEDYVKFPDLDSWDWEGSAKKNAPMFHPDRMNKIWILTGLNERLISFMDFDKTMLAYIDEDQQAAVHRLFDKLCDFYDDLIGRFRKWYHADIVLFNDDWGTQRAPQFSAGTCREMIAPYIKRLVESCHKRGMYFELHCCGRNHLLAPVMVECGVDFWHPQEINDLPLLFELVGRDMPLGLPPETSPEMSDGECLAAVENFVRRYGFDVVATTNMAAPQHPRTFEFIYYASREIFAGL
ncbi:MAG: uroporphyrinogen decarboxylase family protein [Clostridiales bacterium]|nr:uroporphyrinogen decarboxylase family protein [Clostridiales bacterium]